MNGPGSGVRAGGLLKTEGEDDTKLKENKSKCCWLLWFLHFLFLFYFYLNLKWKWSENIILI